MEGIGSSSLVGLGHPLILVEVSPSSQLELLLIVVLSQVEARGEVEDLKRACSLRLLPHLNTRFFKLLLGTIQILTSTLETHAQVLDPNSNHFSVSFNKNSKIRPTSPGSVE